MNKLLLSLGLALIATSAAKADEVQITPEIPFIEITVGDQTIYIERIQDNENRLDDEFTKTSRACPPFCIQPNQVAQGVQTVGELEVLSFLEEQVNDGVGILVDARLPDFYEKGTIPGSVNIPFNVLDVDGNQHLESILLALGAKKGSGETLDFTNSKQLMFFCNGLWCGQSPRAIRNLLEAGYPAEKLFYYRGGMQAWLSVGLTEFVPGENATN